MSRLLSNDNGREEWFDYDPINDTMAITVKEDVSGLLDAMNTKRKNEMWSGEVKKDFVHFAKIPASVEIELRNKGISLTDKNCTQRLIKEIQTNYPYLLAHHGKRFA
jgi:hypothetical protein